MNVEQVHIYFVNFSDGEGFDDLDSLNDRGNMNRKHFWLGAGLHDSRS